MQETLQQHYKQTTQSQLPEELWLSIFRLCDPSTQAKVNVASKWAHGLCLPLIYRDVNLSTHNLGIIQEPGELLQVDSLLFEGEENGLPQDADAVPRAQKRFLETMLQHKEYARYVRTLTWSLLMFNFRRESDLIRCLQSQTWRVFETLTRVRRLDLVCCNPLMPHSYDPKTQACLFPAATSIRIQGLMTDALAKAIISNGPHPERIEQLCIDNVQYWGQLTQKPLPTHGLTRAHKRLQDLAVYPPGPIRGLFTPLPHYPHLKTLYLRKVASKYETDMKWVPEADVAVYREWAKFITSVKGQLEGFSFEQSSLPGDKGIRGFGPNQQMRPIDRRFQEHMLPVFLERGWKRLKRLEIRGSGIGRTRSQ